jgi:elongation factor G
MGSYTTEQIRNLVIAGHSSTGKTTLVDCLLFKAGAITRQGRPEDKNTVGDFEPDEKARSYSIYSAVSHYNQGGVEVNLFDVPGAMDFFGAAIGPFHAADLLLLAVDAARGVEVTTRRFWDLARSLNMPVAILLTKMDSEHANFEEAVATLQEMFGDQCKPLALPDGNGAAFKSVTSVLADDGDEDARLAFIEAAVEADDELLEAYLEGEEFSDEVLNGLVSKALSMGVLVPVLPISTVSGGGVDELMDFIVRFAPKPGALPRKVLKGDEEVVLEQTPDGPVRGFVFKAVIDPFVGKINFFRVISGVVQSGQSYYCDEGSRPEKFSQLFKMLGKEQQPVQELVCGDIGAVAKINSLGIGKAFASVPVDFRIPPFGYPSPLVALAIEPQSRGDEQKLNQSLRRLSDEDPTFQAERNRQTKELVARGLGTLHLDIMLAKMESKYGVKVVTRQPKIPYLETITAKAEARYRHKKQTGGAGQFGEVAIRIEPTERGAGFVFHDEIVGGVIPGQFIPSVEKGIANVMEEGILAGYPVVDVAVHLWDGKSHPVDSKDIAFQVAGREAFKQAFEQARPTFLEPIGLIEVTVPNKYMGDIISDLNTRRARIMGSEARGKFQTIRAEVPYAEVATYSSDLRSITGGEGSYTLEFVRYELVPSNLREAIIQQAKRDAESS